MNCILLPTATESNHQREMEPIWLSIKRAFAIILHTSDNNNQTSPKRLWLWLHTQVLRGQWNHRRRAQLQDPQLFLPSAIAQQQMRLSSLEAPAPAFPADANRITPKSTQCKQQQSPWKSNFAKFSKSCAMVYTGNWNFCICHHVKQKFSRSWAIVNTGNLRVLHL